MSILPLTQCKSGIISRVDIEGPEHERVIEMGATPGAFIEIIRRAPLGDPVQVALRGYTLTLRGADAARIFVIAGREEIGS